ncbi:retinol dehydrogenase 12 [Aaosphaeria arxii CBS 175.79]|uniref:Retinol dehydrogenase 12 n=1 Tax=Aaosphaeria arxii CBS 175.79 TaxID=1450172 RepID=A0A6A5Y0T8_9PLEO|nr:retinol dehydrogenase 12 [Aaosphaeria arxii CBS 175.79]KAF2018541.1 retinol dehydrogenase 12 [Aaosphaeria arxii CBS 175.79]
MATTNNFNGGSGALEVARRFSTQAKGKTILVTGVSIGGIGDAITRAFAAGGASTIIITGRSEQRLAEVTKALTTDYPGTTFRTLRFDLYSLSSTQQAVKEASSDLSIPAIDIIVGNAGGSQFGERVITEDGLEQHFSGYVSHFLLVQGLIPKLRAASKSSPPGSTRVVMMTSGAQMASGIRFSDINLDCNKALPDDEKPDFTIFKALGVQETDKYDHNIAYAQCNTAKTLMALSLNSHLVSDKIYSFAVHPGIVRSAGTNPLWDQLGPEQLATIEKFGGFKSIDQGAATILVAALDPELKPDGGIYLSDCEKKPAPAHAVDESKADRLWKLTTDILSSRGYA